MNKIFLSFLGTNNYIPCNYTCKDDEDIKNVRFVQEATITWFCRDWSAQDEIIIFTTKESSKKNWLDNGHKDKDRSSITCQGLNSRLEDLDLSASVQNKHIPSGRNEEEIWKIFSIVYECLHEESELYFDITHAFRSLPLLAIVIMNYAKVTKKIHVKAICYGAMEALGSFREINNMVMSERNVPVFDLLSYDQLLDWTTAIDRFVETGDASAVTQLAERKIHPVLKETKGQDDDARNIRKLAKHLQPFTEVLSTCRKRSITDAASLLRQAFKQVKDQQTIQPLKPLLQKLERKISGFSGNEILDGIAAAKWCLEHSLIQQGFTILQETIISYVLLSVLNEDSVDRNIRKLPGEAITITLKGLEFDEWYDSAKENKELIRKLCKWLEPRGELCGCMGNLTDDRNDLNHAGMRDGPMSADKFYTKLAEYLSTITKLLEQD